MSAPLIRQITLHNFLSFGPDGVSVELLPLNVLIGPNASGKSNLLETLAILRATTGDLPGVIREGGGISEYLWKGEGNESGVLDVQVEPPASRPGQVLRYRIVLAQVAGRLDIAHEYLDIAHEYIGIGNNGSTEADMLYAFEDSKPIVYPVGGPGSLVGGMKLSQSVLAQLRDPGRFPEITYLADQFRAIALFSDWNSGRRTAARLPQLTDLPSDFLLPDASNLGLVLHDLAQTSAKRDELIGYLRRFYEKARHISTRIHGGTLQLYIEEEGGRLIPATRLSDGTLRYLCLLAILCHPSPPPMIAIEEPELGLHPDILPTVAELLRKASERTQLFVTTHSDTLVSALSDVPESILVCEATPDGTSMKRLEAEPLRDWLEKYSLGEIWRMGEIGGNRW
jgi:predicted ATPase